MEKILIISNGENINLNNIEEYDFIICADGGYNHIKNKYNPDIIIGDFDSLKHIPKNIQTIKYPCSKDKTDTELAIIKAIELNAEYIYITGINGSRADHFFAVLCLLKKYYKHNIILLNKNQSIFIIKPYTEYTFENMLNKTVSFFSFSNRTQIIEDRGFLYPLKGRKLKQKLPIGVSNKIIDNKAYIYYKKGMLLCFLEN